MRETICALRPPQKANKGQSRAIERLKKKMFENEFLLLLNSPTIPFRIHNRNGKVRKRWGRDRGGPFSWSRGCLFSRAPVHDLWDSGTQAQIARMLSQLLPRTASAGCCGASAPCWPSPTLPLLWLGFRERRLSSQLPPSPSLRVHGQERARNALGHMVTLLNSLLLSSELPVFTVLRL